MTYTIKCRLDDDAFAMMRKARTFCANDESAAAFCTDIKGNVEVWTVETTQNIDERLEQDPDVLEYERPPLHPAPQGGYGRG
jgi:hypothetical protein